MANAGTLATNAILQFLQAPAGLTQNLAEVDTLQAIHLAPIGPRQIFSQNVAQAVVEKSVDLQYPALFVYCDKLSNDLREKFRTFSGKVNLTIEVRVSQDRIEGLESLLQSYVDVVTRILDQNRGDWGNGMFYTGGYQVVFGQLAHGGRNLIQTGKITFELAVSID